MSSYEDKLSSLGNALGRLSEALEVYQADHTDMIRDALIKRFEFTFELFWKVMKAYLINQGYDVKSLREVLQKAYAEGFLEDEQSWLSMLKDRNLASHLYDESLANELVVRISDYYPKLKTSYQKLL